MIKMATKVTRAMLAEEWVPTVNNLSRVTDIIKDSVTYPILPVVPIVDIETEWTPENAPVGSLIIVKSDDSWKKVSLNGHYNYYTLMIKVHPGAGDISSSWMHIADWQEYVRDGNNNEPSLEK